MVSEVSYGRPILSKSEPVGEAGGMLSEIWWVAWRSLKRLIRNPFLLFFSLFFPLIWLAMFSQTFSAVFQTAASASGRAPPYDYVAVMLPGVVVMTAIQSAAQSGFGMVADIESGFMDKLFVAPIRRGSVLAGKLLADGIRMMAQALIVLALAALFTVLFGWRIPFATGVPGVLVIVALAGAFGVAFSGLSNFVALRTKNTEATMMVSFTLTFPLLFLSTGIMQKSMLPQWVQDFSALNPVSYVADAARPLILSGWDWGAIGSAFAAIVVLGAVLNGLAVMAFRAQGK